MNLRMESNHGLEKEIKNLYEHKPLPQMRPESFISVG